MLQQSKFWIYMSKRVESRDRDRNKYLYTYYSLLYTKAKIEKQPKCLSTDTWINKTWFMHTMEYSSALKKRKGILQHG